jgi:hypothetical protein
MNDCSCEHCGGDYWAEDLFGQLHYVRHDGCEMLGWYEVRNTEPVELEDAT